MSSRPCRQARLYLRLNPLERDHSIWLSGAVISNVRKLLTHNQSIQAIRE